MHYCWQEQLARWIAQTDTDMNPYYTDYAEYLQRIFPGRKVQKLSIDAGFSCPNRDGTIGTGGCIYCDNRTFSPAYCRESESVTAQIEAGKRFFARKYPDMEYLAYFQAYTNTHGPIGKLMALYREALSCEGVAGLIIGTRPDCISSELLSELSALNREHPVIVEYGAETSHNATLALLNRGHTWEDTCRAAERTAEAGLSCGLHLIAGLPDETDEMILQTIGRCTQLPIDTLKIHQLQVIRGTELARRVAEGTIKVHIRTLEEYVELCARIAERVPRRIAIERFVSQAPPDITLAPRWGVKNYQFANMLLNRLKETASH